jgi:dTDP-4-amino-4,6-dideoxygalactose transaminase
MMLNGPFSPWPNYNSAEKQAVLEVLNSNKVNYWTGQEGRQFEQEFAVFTECKHAIAVANGTVALDLAWQALAMPKGAEVIVTSRTFLASVSSIVLAGLTPVFADIDKDTQNISASTIRAKITNKTKAILCVHLAGWPCEMDDIAAIANEFNLLVVEDCAQAHGAKYKDRSVGSFGDISAWSFCQDKIMTTAGEGGMVTTNSKVLWQKMWAFKDHGKSWSAIYEQSHPPGFRWLHESFGTNWRMTEMQAAVGRLQLKEMPLWQQIRSKYSQQILSAAAQFSSLRVAVIPQHIQHAFYKCYVFVEPSKLADGWHRDRIMQTMNEHGVPCFSGSCSEVYLEKAFEHTSFRPKNRLPIAKELAETSLMFLVHPTLTQAEIDLTTATLTAIMKAASL